MRKGADIILKDMSSNRHPLLARGTGKVLAILAAAQLGTPRLIDNIRLNLNPVSDWGMLNAR